MPDCIFCKIGKKEVKVLIVAESENFIGFLDVQPRSPGHSLVIPKRHFDNFVSLDLNLAQEFVKICQETIKKIGRGLNANDFTLGVNEGELAGQAVHHFHFHVIPRFKHDRGGSIHSVVFNEPVESVEEIYSKIIK